MHRPGIEQYRYVLVMNSKALQRQHPHTTHGGKTMVLKIIIGIVFGSCGFAAIMAALAPKTEMDWRDDNAAQEDWCGRYREGRDA